MNRKTKALEFVDMEYNISVTGRHVLVTESMKDYAIDKVSKIERFMNRIIDVNIIMDIQKLDHRVEIILKAGNMKITSSATSSDMYASIDKAVHKLEAQILRYKSKIQDHHAKGIKALDMNVNVYLNPTADEDLEEEFELELGKLATDTLKPHEIVRQEKRPLKTLTYDEAIMKMELSRDAFMIFKNEADLQLRVIYRCSDGNYGVIDPNC